MDKVVLIKRINSKKIFSLCNAVKKIFILLLIIFSANLIFAKEKKQDVKSQSSSESQTKIIIENALRSTNMKDAKKEGKDKEEFDDIILFEGDVKISVEKDGSKTVISSDKIIYNRTREMLYAEGKVLLEQTDKAGAISTINATSVLFNTSTLEGIFDEGRIIQAETNSLNLPSGSTLVVASDTFARNNSGTIAFKKGELTFCNNENPHWKIKATRIWLLPGNEFAFFNAVLFVGNIPLLYLPAFYYPKDELVFNPVFSYKNRQGFSIQTTTYLMGRKPLEQNNSTNSSSEDDMSKYFNFIKPSKLMDQELQGLILHNLDTPYKGDTSNYLKLIADWYSNLGVGIGVSAAYNSGKVLKNVKADLLLGFGNTVFPTNSPYVYLPFGPSGKKYYEKSNFIGMEIPFRYKAGFQFEINKPFNLSFKMPIYSDPFINYDYGDRNESMDWLSYLLNNPLVDPSDLTEDEKLNNSEIDDFSWDISGNYNFNLPSSVKPFINNLAISSFSSSLNFKSKVSESNSLLMEDDFYLYSSQRKFFYPSQVSPLKFNAKISGTILSIGENSKSNLSKINYPVDLIVPSEFVNDTEKNNFENLNEALESEQIDSSQSLVPEKYDFETKGLPELFFNCPKVSSDENDLKFKLNYSLSTDFLSQLNYSSEGINIGSDFKWNRLQSSFVQVKIPITIDDNLSIKKSFFNMKNSFSFIPQYQVHPFLSKNLSFGGYTEDEIDSILKSDYSATSLELVNTNNLSFKPLIYIPMLKDSSIAYNTSLKLMRTKFIGDADNLEWDVLTLDPDDTNSITTHTLSVNLDAKQHGGDFSQTLIYTSTLPPQNIKHYLTLKLVFPYISLTNEIGIRQNNNIDKEWVNEPYRQSFTLSLFENKLKFTESFNYDVEKNNPDSLKLSLSYSGLQLAYTMKYSNTYDFDSDSGWIRNDDEQKFIPNNASLAYSLSNVKFYAWKNRISIAPSLSTSLVVDFIRPTNSYFIFTPGIKFKINDALDFTFSATSRNDVLYRYVQSSLGYPGRIPGEENLFVDLINSFRFDDINLRKGSGFKLKSLNFTFSHDLHDWDLKSEFKLEPRLVNSSDGRKYYDFNPYFTLSVVWRPMESMKTEIKDDYGTWKIK